MPAHRDGRPQDISINGSCLAEDGTTFLDRMELEVTGVYQLVLSGDATQTGDVEILVTSATDGEGDIEVDGDTETATVEQPGAIFTLDFELDAGDGFFVAFPRVAYDDLEAGTCLRAAILDPEGISINGSCLAEDGTTFIDQAPVATGGTYQIVIDGDSTQMGEVDVQVTSTDSTDRQTIVTLDMEGVLVPEIWIAVAERTGIDALRRTTRDEPDYDVLMRVPARPARRARPHAAADPGRHRRPRAAARRRRLPRRAARRGRRW